MIRHIESLGVRRLAIAVCLPVFLLLVPFVAFGGALLKATKDLWVGVPEVIQNAWEMWSKDFKPCKKV